MRSLITGALLSIVLGAGPADVARAQGPQPPATLEAVLQADRTFSRAVEERSRERFLSFIDPAAVFSGGQPGELRGHDAIAKGWAAYFDTGGPTLRWQPTSGELLVGGDVAVTVGAWTRRGRSPDGKTVESRGQYVTIWIRKPDGSWKVVSDIGSTAP